MKHRKIRIAGLVMLVLLGLVCVGIFLSKEKVTEKPSGEVSKAEEAKEQYLAFIKQIEEAAKDKFQTTTTEDLEISSIFNYGIERESGTMGYNFVDLNSDGIYELLFGENDKWLGENRIYNIYGFWDGEIHQVADGIANNYYQICEDGKIVNTTAKRTPYAYYNYKEGGLELIEAFIYDREKDKVHPWFYNTETVTVENATSVRLSKVCEVTGNYKWLTLDFVPFKNLVKEADAEVTYEDKNNLTYADLEGIEFTFSSGAGGWRTKVTIDAGGRFYGHYSDTDMGVNNFIAPGGYRKECTFSGQFSAMTKTGPFEYTMQCEFLEKEQEPGTDEIIDKVQVVYSDPYGFDDAGEFKLYLPGKAENELTESFLGWTNGTIEDGQLSCYGLYNVNGGMGFSGEKEAPQPEYHDDSVGKPMIFDDINPWPEEKLQIRQEKYEDRDDLTFADWTEKEFTAMAGDFGTVIKIASDGTFTGSYSTMSKYLTGDNYPNGTREECHFTGKFTSLTKTGSYEYSMKCENLEVQGTPGEEKIVDGVRVITTEPYGFCNVEDFILYLPGTRKLDLPEEFLKWNVSYREDGLLDGYVLYGTGDEIGFVNVCG